MNKKTKTQIPKREWNIYIYFIFNVISRCSSHGFRCWCCCSHFWWVCFFCYSLPFATYLVFKSKIHSEYIELEMCRFRTMTTTLFLVISQSFWFVVFFSFSLVDWLNENVYSSINHLFDRHTYPKKIVMFVGSTNFKRKCYIVHSVGSSFCLSLVIISWTPINKIELSSYFTHWTSKTAAAAAVAAAIASVAVTATTKQ